MATDSAYVLAAGDIANGTSATSRWAQTGKLLDSWQGVNSPLYILPLGDNAYNDGTAAEFNSYFDPYWGVGGTQSGYTWKNKYSNLYPVPGNHEARLNGTTYAGYETYFGSQAHAATSYHWSQEITALDGNKYWRVIGLDSNVMTNAAQITYLRAQLLAATTAGPGGVDQHVIIIFHHPLWTPGGYSPGIAGIGGTSTNGAAAAGIIGAIQDATYQGGIKIILNGHDHLYARYNPLRAGTYSTTSRTFAQSPSTVALGFTEILVGTGGNAPDALAAGPNLSNVAHYKARTTANADGGSGVLKMDLRSDRAICQFVTIDNTTTGVVEDSFTISLTTVPPVVNPTPLQELPMSVPRYRDTEWAGTVGSPLRHEGRPQAVVKKTGDTWVYVGGNFNRIEDINGAEFSFNNLSRYNATTGGLDSDFNPDLNGQVKWMALSADESLIFVVGDFTTVGTTTRNHIAAFNTSDGSLNTSYFNGFACNGNINACAIDGTKLYVGGSFTTIGGSSRNRAAKLDVSSSSVTVDGTWNPNCSQPVMNVVTCIDGATHKIALNLDPQGTVNGTGAHSVALVNITDGTKYWGLNPTAGGGYVMTADDNHNGGQIYFGSSGSGGNKIHAISYAGSELWWFDGDGDVQGVGLYDNNVVVCKHDGLVATTKNTIHNASNTVVAQGVFIVNKDGVLQPAPWRSQFIQSGNDAYGGGVLACFGAFGIEETDFRCLIMTGEFTGVTNFAGTQTKTPNPRRIAQFNGTGTTTPPGTHGWSVGYWDGDYWGSAAGSAQSASVTAPAGSYAFGGTAPVVVGTFGGADALVVSPVAAFSYIAATPTVTTELFGTADVTAPAAQFSFAGPQVSVQGLASVNVITPPANFRFAGGGHGVIENDTTVVLRRPKRFKTLDEEVQQGKVVR